MTPNKLLIVRAAFVAAVACLIPVAAGAATLTVQVDQPGHAISPALWGIFFEDINLSADGGIYAELVRNRNFQDSDKPDHWTPVSSGDAKVALSIDVEKPMSPKNPRSLKVDDCGHRRQTGGGGQRRFLRAWAS